MTGLRAGVHAFSREMPHKLREIDVEEVSLVDQAANGREFLLLKASGASPGAGHSGGSATAQPGEVKEKPMSRLTETINSAIEALKHLGSAAEEEDERTKAAAKDQDPAGDGGGGDGDGAEAKKAQDAPGGGDGGDGETVSKADHEAALQKAREEAKAEAEAAAANEIGDLKKAVERLERESGADTLRTHIREKGWAGDLEKNVEMAVQMAEHLPDDVFKSWLQEQDASAARLKAMESDSDLFSEAGATGSTEMPEGIGKAVDKIRKAMDDTPEGGDAYAQARKAMDPDTYAAAQRAAEAAKPPRK